jgi:hypothetical protein
MKYKIPRLHYVVFLDHTRDSRDLIIASIVGEIIEETDLKVVIRNWAVLENITDEEKVSNEEHYTIAKSTIKQRTRLYPRERKAGR